MFAAALTAAALTAATLAGPDFTPAPRVDHRPCVSAREFNSVNTQIRKADLEKRWEVQHRGHRAPVPGLGHATLYPRCGYSRSEAWYGVRYQADRHGRLWAVGMIWWRAPADQPAPEPAPAPTPPPGPPQVVQP